MFMLLKFFSTLEIISQVTINITSNEDLAFLTLPL